MTDKAQWPADIVERRLIADLKPYPRNARIHPKSQIEALARSIENDGVTDAILVDEDNVIVRGHGRLMAAQKLGIKELPVNVVRGWSEERKAAYRIWDNQSALLSEWNIDLLRTELGDLKASDYDLSLTGFDPNELVKFSSSGEVDPAAEETPEVLQEAVSKRGDLWILGDHRLLCGDATVADDVKRLNGKDNPHLMVTDPPYGVDYEGGAVLQRV